MQGSIELAIIYAPTLGGLWLILFDWHSLGQNILILSFSFAFYIEFILFAGKKGLINLRSRVVVSFSTL